MDEGELLNLRDYIGILSRRWLIVAACTIGCLVLAVVYSLLQTRLYSATSEIIINQSTAADLFDPITGNTASSRLIENEARFIESRAMREAVADPSAEGALSPTLQAGVLNERVIAIDASTDSDADVLKIAVTMNDPVEAAAVSNKFASKFIELRKQRAVDDYRSAADTIQTNISDLQARLADENVADRSALEQQRITLLDALNDLDVTADLASAGSAQVITPAVPKESPVSPLTRRNAVLGTVLGLILGVGAAVMLESLDHSISGKQEIEAATHGLPNLAVIPTVKEWKNRGTTRIVSVDEPNSPTAEAYRSLRAALQFVAVDQDLSVIQLTSANPGEGKTTTSVNLAVAMAKAGRRVALVDADLRKPRIHEFFGLSNEPGLTSVIIGQTDAASTCQVVEDKVGLLAVMPSGPLPPGPSELLGSRRAQEVFASLRGLADVVIVDSPPVLPVSDALVMSRYVDATLLVANGSRTQQGELRRALELLQQVEARVVGTILNQVRKNEGGYGYGYGYSYGHDQASNSWRFGLPALSSPGRAGRAGNRPTPAPSLPVVANGGSHRGSSGNGKAARPAATAPATNKPRTNGATAPTRVDAPAPSSPPTGQPSAQPRSRSGRVSDMLDIPADQPVAERRPTRWEEDTIIVDPAGQ